MKIYRIKSDEKGIKLNFKFNCKKYKNWILTTLSKIYIIIEYLNLILISFVEQI